MSAGIRLSVAGRAQPLCAKLTRCDESPPAATERRGNERVLSAPRAGLSGAQPVCAMAGHPRALFTTDAVVDRVLDGAYDVHGRGLAGRFAESAD